MSARRIDIVPLPFVGSVPSYSHSIVAGGLPLMS